MNYLLINTANEELVIVLDKNGTIFACNEPLVKKHNEAILPAIQSVLNKAGVKLADMDEFGVVIGPGSFTGIRVGIATVKAFKEVFNKPVRAINNLDLLYKVASKQGCFNTVAIEGSLNSYFVGRYDGKRLNIYERNLTAEELNKIAAGERVAFYSNKQKLASGVEVSFDNEAFVEVFRQCSNYNLTPVYYQLSQAENDKISKADIVVREAEVWDIKAINELAKNYIKGNNLEQKLLTKEYIAYVAEIDEVVGFALAKTNNSEVEMEFIVVGENFRNHGIGEKLIMQVEALAKDKNNQIVVKVKEEDFNLKTLLFKMGYKELNKNKLIKNIQ